VQAPFPRLSYDDAADILKKKGLPFEWGGDFGAPDETALSEEFDRPIMVHRYPSAVKAFYMKPDPIAPRSRSAWTCSRPRATARSSAAASASPDLDLLLQRIKEHNLPQEAFEWYLDLRRYGSVPHGGFGMGIERCVSWICGLEHLREGDPVPADALQDVSLDERSASSRSAARRTSSTAR
jgi:asparaginyl-tRNA synthetase